MMENQYSCPTCQNKTTLEDFEAKPIFNNKQIKKIELIIEAWCKNCQTATLHTQQLTIQQFKNQLTQLQQTTQNNKQK